MENFYIVYKTDTWHSHASREILGIGTNQHEAINLCIERAKQEGETIPEEELSFLADRNQTQNYSGPGEFIMVPMIPNKLY